MDHRGDLRKCRGKIQDYSYSIQLLHSKSERTFAYQLAREAEEAANKPDMGALHKITRRLCGARLKCSTVFCDREGRGPRTDHAKAYSEDFFRSSGIHR